MPGQAAGAGHRPSRSLLGGLRPFPVACIRSGPLDNQNPPTSPRMVFQSSSCPESFDVRYKALPMEPALPKATPFSRRRMVVHRCRNPAERTIPAWRHRWTKLCCKKGAPPLMTNRSVENPGSKSGSGPNQKQEDGRYAKKQGNLFLFAAIEGFGRIKGVSRITTVSRHTTPQVKSPIPPI